ncbi:MAG: DNA polymerase III subunit delta' [Porticoccus sp.]
MSEQLTPAAAMHYPWQEAQWIKLIAQVEQQRIPHALILSGPKHTGKNQFALTLAQRMLCESPVDGYACGRCKQCHLVATNNHPDLLKVLPEDEGKAIRIDNIRALGEFASKTSQQGGWKVAVIYPAEAMNQNASNALLKNLEEPGPNTLLLLVCHEPARLSATVKSRCRMVKFPVPTTTQSGPWLSQVVGQDQDIEQLLGFAEGRPLLALQLIETDLLERRRVFEGMLDDLAAHRATPLLVAETLVEKKSVANDPAVTVDWLYGRVSSDIRSDQGTISSRLMFRYIDRLIQAKKLLQSSANPNIQLLWEELLLNWQLLFVKR